MLFIGEWLGQSAPGTKQGLSLSCYLNFSGKDSNSVCYSQSRWYHVLFVGTSFHHIHTCTHTHSYLQGGKLPAETIHFLFPTHGLWITKTLHLLLSLLGPVLFLYQDQLSNMQVLVTQSRLALCDSMVHRPLGSSVHEISQGISFPRGSFWPRDQLGSPTLLADSLLSEPPGKPNLQGPVLKKKAEPLVEKLTIPRKQQQSIM